MAEKKELQNSNIKKAIDNSFKEGVQELLSKVKSDSAEGKTLRQALEEKLASLRAPEIAVKEEKSDTAAETVKPVEEKGNG